MKLFGAVLFACIVFSGCQSAPRRVHITPPPSPEIPEWLEEKNAWQPERKAVETDAEEEGDESANARDAAEYYRSRRVLGDGDVPYDKYFDAQERIRKMPVHKSVAKGSRRELSLGSWVQLGPGNIGGITRA